MRMIRHVVLINWQEGADPAEIETWIDFCNRIPDECPMVYNWFSSYGISLADPENSSTHDYCLHFDLRSREEWIEYLNHPFPEQVYSTGLKVIDLARTASANMLVNAEPVKSFSAIRERLV